MIRNGYYTFDTLISRTVGSKKMTDKTALHLSEVVDKEDLVASIAAQMMLDLVESHLKQGKRIRSGSQLSDDMAGLLVDIPNTSAPHYIELCSRWFTQTSFECLDFGCGNAPHKSKLESIGANWSGCDFENSTDPATLLRNNSDIGGRVTTYDGRILPYSDDFFHLVWSWQALEHVQEPELTFAEISRVLQPGSFFIGATSFLEPYHAKSTYSYTPYGFKLICERHGMQLLECAPSIDGLTYLVKKIAIILDMVEDPVVLHEKLSQKNLFEPVREAMKQAGREDDWPELMAQLCGTFRFVAQKNH